MLGRVSISTLLLIGATCDRGSATNLARTPETIRVATDTVTRATLEQNRSGVARHLSELLLEPTADQLTILGREGNEVVVAPLDDAVDREALAGRLHHPHLVSVRVIEGALRLTLEHDSASFRLEDLTLVGGSHRLSAEGLVLEPTDEAGVRIELVPAPPERHWRLINGGHVDLVPLVRRHEAERLRQVSSIKIVPLPVTGVISLVAGKKLGLPLSELAPLVDLAALAEVVCGRDCRATRTESQVSASKPNLDAVELIYLSSTDAEALGARVLAHQLLSCGIRVDLRPLEFAALNRRIVAADFGLAVVVAPADPDRLRQFLQLLDIAEDEAGSRILPLWNHELFAAYDRSICNVHPDSVTSWRWLADVRRCEVLR